MKGSLMVFLIQPKMTGKKYSRKVPILLKLDKRDL